MPQARIRTCERRVMIAEASWPPRQEYGLEQAAKRRRFEALRAARKGRRRGLAEARTEGSGARPRRRASRTRSRSWSARSSRRSPRSSSSPARCSSSRRSCGCWSRSSPAASCSAPGARLLRPLLLLAWRLLKAAYRIAEAQVTPARAVAAVALAAAVVMAVGQWSDYRSISVGSDAYAGGIQTVAPAPEIVADQAGEAHSWAARPDRRPRGARDRRRARRPSEGGPAARPARHRGDRDRGPDRRAEGPRRGLGRGRLRGGEGDAPRRLLDRDRDRGGARRMRPAARRATCGRSRRRARMTSDGDRATPARPAPCRAAAPEVPGASRRARARDRDAGSSACCRSPASPPASACSPRS